MIMGKRRKRKLVQETVEIGNDGYDIVTLYTIKTMLLEMFKEEEQVLIETVSSLSTFKNIRIKKKNNEHLISPRTTRI